MVPSTTGLAAGSTLLEAVLHGLFEVVERDAIAQLAEGRTAGFVDLATVRGEEELWILQQLSRAHAEVKVLDLSPFVPLPTFLAGTFDPSLPGPAGPLVGHATHLRPSDRSSPGASGGGAGPGGRHARQQRGFRAASCRLGR